MVARYYNIGHIGKPFPSNLIFGDLASGARAGLPDGQDFSVGQVKGGPGVQGELWDCLFGQGGERVSNRRGTTKQGQKGHGHRYRFPGFHYFTAFWGRERKLSKSWITAVPS